MLYINKELTEQVKRLGEQELNDLMFAIMDRYREISPDKDVVIVAMHKDPNLRKQEYDYILSQIPRELEWYREQIQKMGG